MRRRDQRLREAVLARRGCLGDLPEQERRVLTLRAGVGAAHVRSRRSVARRLDLSVRRVVRLERAGLRRLRRLAANGCGPPTVEESLVSAHVSVPAAVTALRRGGARGAGEPAPSSSAEPGGGGGAEPVSPPEEEPARGGVAGRSVTHTPAGGLDLTVPLILSALAIAAWGLARVLRRDVAAAPPPPPPEPPDSSWSAPPPGGTGDEWTSPPRR